MRGVDTNVLVRYLTQDDVAQARRVDALVAEATAAGERLHLDDIVLCELVWVLRAAYRLDKETVAGALDRIFGTALFAFEDRALLRLALDDYRRGRGDFADCLIGRRNLKAGCADTATFDRNLDELSAFSLL